MSDKQRDGRQSRRNFLKTSAVVGATAVTGTAAFSGGAAGQTQGNRPTIENIQEAVTANQDGQGLVVVQVGGVSLNALNANNVQLFINETLVDISDVNILSAGDDLVQIVLEDSLNDLVDVVGNTVTVTLSILGGAVTETQNVPVVNELSDF